MSEEAEILDPRVMEDPWSLVEEALGYEARDEVVPDDLQDAVSQAAVLMTSLALYRNGIDEDQIDRLFYGDREWSVKLGYAFATREFSCEIVWKDGERHVLNGSPEEVGE